MARGSTASTRGAFSRPSTARAGCTATLTRIRIAGVRAFISRGGSLWGLIYAKGGGGRARRHRWSPKQAAQTRARGARPRRSASPLPRGAGSASTDRASNLGAPHFPCPANSRTGSHTPNGAGGAVSPTPASGPPPRGRGSPPATQALLGVGPAQKEGSCPPS